MTIRSKVTPSKTADGIWPHDIEVIATARFLELVGGANEDVTMAQVRDFYAQVFWELVEDKHITVGDLCFIAGHLTAKGVFALDEMKMYENALTHVMQSGEVDA